MLKTHMQREIMRVARNSDRAKRVIPVRLFAAAQIMAERGYVTITALTGDRYRLDLTKRARAASKTLIGWRRYPPLRTRAFASPRKPPRSRAADPRMSPKYDKPTRSDFTGKYNS